MNLASRRYALLAAAFIAALLGCSLPFAEAPSAEPGSTPAAAVSETPAESDAATEVNPFLPTATPTVDVAAMQEAFHVTGTISANFNGEPMEWQTGSIDAEGETLQLSDWYRAPLQTIADLYEFELYAIDPQSLVDAATAGTATSDSATLTLSFSVQSPSAGQTLTFPLPAGDGLTGADIGYLVPEGDQFGRYLMTSGELTLNLLQVEPGQPASLQGTFAGTMTYAGLLGDPDGELDPERVIEVSQGQVDLESVPYDPIFD